uniref:SH2 domain-containing protein n=1 Tax=Anopheles maculatus TaxID=74869 RepID=A0A182T155_9DIPT
MERVQGSEIKSRTTSRDKPFPKIAISRTIAIKRFALGFLRSTEESLPLMCHKSSPTSPQKKLNDILSEDIYTLDQIVSSKFGDSCKQSFAGSTRLLPGGNGTTTASTTVPAATTTTVADGVEYEFKRNLIRQTNSASSSPKRFPTLTPPKHADSLNSVSRGEDSEELNRASWFQAGLPRELSLEVLTQQSPGAFLVRRSTTKHGCFALSLRVPPGPGPKVVHYLIMKTERGYKIKVIYCWWELVHSTLGFGCVCVRWCTYVAILYHHERGHLFPFLGQHFPPKTGSLILVVDNVRLPLTCTVGEHTSVKG